MKNYDEVRITKVNRGYIVNVGCQTFVSTTSEEVFRGIQEYWDNPVEARKKYEEGYTDCDEENMANRPVRACRA